MPASLFGKAAIHSGAGRPTCRRSSRRSSGNDGGGEGGRWRRVRRGKVSLAALNPFFQVIQRGPSGLVDGEHYFDSAGRERAPIHCMGSAARCYRRRGSEFGGLCPPLPGRLKK